MEPPRRGGFNVYPQSMFRAKMIKNIKNLLLKIFDFYNLRKICLLHGCVFIISLDCPDEAFSTNNRDTEFEPRHDSAPDNF